MQQIESGAVDGAERSGDQLHRRHRDHQRHHPGRKQQSANRHRSIRADIRRGEFPDQRYRRSEIIGEQAIRQWRDPCGQRHDRRADGITAGKARREENRHLLRGRCADHAKRF